MFDYIDKEDFIKSCYYKDKLECLSPSSQTLCPSFYIKEVVITYNNLDYKLGPFRCFIDGYYIVSDNKLHPHIGSASGRICVGDYLDLSIEKSLLKIALTVENILSNYNYGSCYKSLFACVDSHFKCDLCSTIDIVRNFYSVAPEMTVCKECKKLCYCNHS